MEVIIPEKQLLQIFTTLPPFISLLRLVMDSDGAIADMVALRNIVMDVYSGVICVNPKVTTIENPAETSNT